VFTDESRSKERTPAYFLIIGLCFLVQMGTSAHALTRTYANYYPVEFRESFENPDSQFRLPKVIFDVLRRAHLARMNQPDVLKDSCDKSKDPSCYQQKPLGYRFARTELFGELHLLQSGDQYGVRGVYCSKIYTSQDFPNGSAPGPGKIPDPRVLNTEHTWPQSKFSRSFPKDLQKGDLHILFPVDSATNSTRSNYPFGEVSAVTHQPCENARKGHSATGRTVFEPADEHKGNVARAMFYFSMRYKMSIDAEQEEVLRKWNRQDPVDQAERDRNEEIFKIQKNRNPFIDHPELASIIQDF